MKIDVLANHFSVLRDAREQDAGTGHPKAANPGSVPDVKALEADSTMPFGFRRLWRRLRSVLR